MRKCYIEEDGVKYYIDSELAQQKECKLFSFREILKSRHYNVIPRARIKLIEGKLWYLRDISITRKWFESYSDCIWVPITTDMLHVPEEQEGGDEQGDS